MKRAARRARTLLSFGKADKADKADRGIIAGEALLSFQDERSLPTDYRGVVHVWDIDKTYLETRFSSLGGLARIPLELAVDKHAIPGMPEVLRGLRYGAGDGYAGVPIYFVSASPTLLRGILRRRMTLDGVEADGLLLKDWAAALSRLGPRGLRDHMGFKLGALLRLRLRHPLAAQVLVGDDQEADPRVFALYARLLEPGFDDGALDGELTRAGVPLSLLPWIRDALAALPEEHGGVQASFIRRTGSPRSAGIPGPNIAVRDASELARHFETLGLLSPAARGRVDAALAAATP